MGNIATIVIQNIYTPRATLIIAILYIFLKFKSSLTILTYSNNLVVNKNSNEFIIKDATNSSFSVLYSYIIKLY